MRYNDSDILFTIANICFTLDFSFRLGYISISTNKNTKHKQQSYKSEIERGKWKSPASAMNKPLRMTKAKLKGANGKARLRP